MDVIDFVAKFENLLDRACSDLKAEDFEILKDCIVKLLLESYG